MIKSIFCTATFFCIFFLLFPSSASAHLIGQPPFFKVNGTFAGFYNVPSTSLENFSLPQDTSPTHYLVNNPIKFELVIGQLPVPPEIVKKTTFDWDYGDGQKGSGLVNTHIYTKMGAYTLNITASYTDSGVTVPPQLLESIMVTVLPDKNYKLPQSIILMNNQSVKNSVTDILHFSPGQAVEFDESNSRGGSAKIVKYFWDLGDGISSTQKTLTHTFPPNYQMAFPMLRVIDANGFITDSYIQIQVGNGSIQNQTTPQKIHQGFPWALIVLGVLTIVVLLVAVKVFLKRFT